MPDAPHFLSVESAIAIHEESLRLFGGSAGVRDIGMLQSALAIPQSGFGNQYFHRDLFEMGAAYLFHIVKNHPFVDGNKRSGLVAALVFLEANGVEVEASNAAMSEMTLSVAEGKLDKPGIASFLRKHARG